jgi:hypothetical protein
MRPHLSRPALAALAVAALLATAPAAYAIWSAPGSGTATAAAAAAQPVTIVAGAATTQALYPTGTPTGDVAVAITNPNPFRVAGLVLDTGVGSGGFSASAAACGLHFAPVAPGWDIPAGATVQLDLRDSLTMATWAPPSCQGLAVQVFLKAAP